jgi:hypothetical protein
MNNASKLSIFALVVLVGGGAAVSAGVSGCTTTITSGPLTDGGDIDAYVAPTTDAPPPPPVDGGVDAPVTCITQCPILGKVSFGKSSCDTCDTCIATKCCTTATTCFTPASDCPDGGATSCACENDCIQGCDAVDGGAACTGACVAVYNVDAATNPDQQWQAMSTCIQTNCMTQCQ